MSRMLGPITAVAAAAAVWYSAFRPQPPPAVERRWSGHRHTDDFFQKRPFNASDLPDLTGRVALITGGSSGVGIEVARSLYAQGCTVVITSRSQERSDKVARQLMEELEKPSSGKVVGMGLELADLEDVRRFAKDFTSKYQQLNYLCENAGQAPLLSALGYDGPELSKQGYEMLYAANYLGHFLLFQELLPTLLSSSISHWIHDSQLSNLLPSAQRKSLTSTLKKMQQYGNSKVLQVMMSFEAQRRLAESGLAKSLTVTPVTPGMVNTAITNHRQRDGSGDHNPLVSAYAPAMRSPAKSAAEGAATTLYALVSDENEGATGVFIQPYWTPKHRSAPLLGGIDVNLGFELLGQRLSWGLYRWLAHPDAYSEEFIKELWEESMTATGATKVL